MDIAERDLKIGIQYFKKQNFNDAITLFLKVIQIYQDDFNTKKNILQKNSKVLQKNLNISYNKNYVNTLDCISACYIKTENLEKALKYSRIMVALEPFGCKGYLRLSKVYCYLKDQKRAYEVVKRGYLKIREIKNDTNKKHTYRVNEQLYQLLKDEVRRLKDLTSNSISTSQPLPNNTDPLKRLPMELIDKIFQEFSFTFQLESLLVCKYWKNTLINSTHIFQNLRLKKNIKKLDFEKFLKFIARNHHGFKSVPTYLKSLNLEPHESVEQQILTLFFEKDFAIWNFSVHLHNINFHGFKSYFKTGKAFLPNLKSFNLTVPLYIHEAATLEDILKHCGNLEKLVLTVPKFDKRSKNVEKQPITFTKLKFLNITVEKDVQNNPLNKILLDAFLFRNNFPVLKHLTLSFVNIQQETLKKLIIPELKSIELFAIPGINIECILGAMIEKCKTPNGNLEELKIVEKDTKEFQMAMDWKNSLLNSKILSNLNVLVIRNSCILPNLLDSILVASACQLKTCHLVLNKNIVFKNKSRSMMTLESPPYGFIKIEDILTQIPNIEEFSLVGCPRFNNETLRDMVKHASQHKLFDNLKYLNLSMNKIDSNSLMHLFKYPCNLTLDKLVIQYCEISPDSVKYLLDNNKCKSIDYKMNDRVVL